MRKLLVVAVALVVLASALSCGDHPTAPVCKDEPPPPVMPAGTIVLDTVKVICVTGA